LDVFKDLAKDNNGLVHYDKLQERLMLQMGEEADYHKVIARYRSEGLGDATKNL
jgi:hypothetical protein